MNLEFTHKPNYFLCAQLLARYIADHASKLTEPVLHISFEDLQKLFQGDRASATTNLESILNIADEYKLDTLSGDQSLIQNYHLDFEEESLTLNLNTDALQALKDGKTLFHPDAESYN